MADQQAVQLLGLVEDVELRIEGARFATSFLILDVGTLYLMLLGRPWLKMVKAVHDWTTGVITMEYTYRHMEV